MDYRVTFCIGRIKHIETSLVTMLIIPEFLKSHFEKPVAIFGKGVSGTAIAALLDYLKISYIIYDQIEKNLYPDFSEHSCACHSLIIYSPGFPLNHNWLVCARKNGCCTLGELDFASLFWKGKIIAITGTNGKSTLTQFLANSLTNLGLNAIACGNIGSPLSAQYGYFQDSSTIAVCEVSSFQAEGLSHFSPDALLWTNFDEDHLDRYAFLEDYFKAKWVLVNRLKSNYLFIGKSVKQSADDFYYSFSIQPIIVNEEPINDFDLLNECVFSKTPQLENYLLALAYWNSHGYDCEVLKKTALSFEPLQYRLEQIGMINGKTFWNDSKGTNFLATIEALKRFKNKVFWIGGGKCKGGNIEGFVHKISPYIQEAFLIGQTAEKLAKIFKMYGIEALIYKSLDEAIQSAFDKSVSYSLQDIVFSPGFSSFDMFANAEERGIFFEKKVLELKREQKLLEIAVS